MATRRGVRLALALSLSVGAAGAQSPPATVTIEEAARCLGLTAQDLADVRAGKIVSTDYRELTDKELAVTVAMLVDRPIAEVIEAARDGKLLQADPTILGFKEIGDREPTEADFAEVSFTRDEASEIRDLLAVKPGSRFNLSVSEIGRFETLRKRFPSGACERDPACFAAVVQEYRRILLERLLAYRKGGTDAAAPYAREGGRLASPAEELRAAAHGCEVVERRLPEFHRAVLDYPRAQIDGVEHQFSWVKQRVQDRPDFVLKHRMLYRSAQALLGVERQFYVGQSYNSLLIMAGCLPLGEKTIVFYINRTSTDQVAGFAKDMRHSMGRKIMRAEIVSSLERIRAQVGKKR